MNTTTTTLRPFTKSDWQTWSGCESENPEVGEIDYGNGTGLSVILDEKFVNVVEWNEDGSASPVYGQSFDTPALARVVANAILGDPKLTPSLMGEPIGTC